MKTHNRSPRLLWSVLLWLLTWLTACQPVQRLPAVQGVSAAPSTAIPQVTITATDFAFDMPDEVPAGLVALTLKNEGQANHHAIIVRLKEGMTLDDVMSVLKEPQGDPGAVSDMSFMMPDTDPGASNQATVALQPGNWAIFSVSMSDPTGQDHTPDWAKGSIQQFAVTGDATASASPPQADLVLTIGKDDFAMPSELPAGQQTIQVVNASGEKQGYAFFVKLGGDTTVEDILAMFDAFFAGKQPAKMADFHAVGGLMGHDLGPSYYTTIDFAPGNYAVISSINATDFPYSGMAKSFTIAPMANSSTPSATVANTITIPISDTNPTKPNDVTQGRLRISNCVYGGPSVDWLLNGKLTVNGGVTQENLPALDVGGYQYLAPGTYSVAIVPTGQGLDQALIGPLDVSIVAGHRYTLVMLGHTDESSRTPLVIDETEAYQQAGVKPNDNGHITINNIKGVPGIDFSLEDRVRDQNAPYGSFVAALWPSGTFKKLAVTVSGVPDKVIDSADLSAERVGGFLGAGVDFIDCFAGAYPGSMGANFSVESSPYTSLLNALDFLQLQSDESAKNGGQTPGFTTFLKALKNTGLDETLTTGGPYLVFAPTDDAFAKLPQEKLDALIADPQALADLIHTHLIEGYFPYGTLGLIGQGFNRTVTNMRGEPLKVTGNDSGLFINGKPIGETSGVFIANGTRIMSVPKLLPATAETTAPAAQPSASEPSIPTTTISFVGHTGEVHGVAISPDGKYLATAAYDGTAALWDTATGQQVRHFSGHTATVETVAFSPDGQWLLTASEDKTIRLWDVATGKTVHVFAGNEERIDSASFSPAGKTIAGVVEAQSVKIWEVASGKLLLTISQPDVVISAAFAPDGKHLATGGLDHSARLWDVATGEQVQTFSGHSNNIGALQFSPDGHSLLTGSDDGTARVWDVATGQTVHTLAGQEAAVVAVAYSPDGKLIATGSDDHSAWLWDATTGQAIGVFSGHTGSVHGVAFSPDGRQLATGSFDKSARLWQVQAAAPAPTQP